MPWRRWAKRQIQEKPGRAILVFAGGAVIVAAFNAAEESREFAIVAMVVGGFLLAAGGLRVVSGSAGPGGFTIETQPDPATAATVAEEVTEEASRPGADVTVDEDELLDATRFFVADQVLKELLQPTEGPLAGCEFHLYVFDADLDRLMPVFEPDDAKPSEGWAAGTGATGVAYETVRYVLVTGPDTHNAKYGLTEDQQKRYAKLHAVAAVPVANARGSPIAVLSASSEDAANQLGTEEGYEHHLALAISVARVLVDLLHWFTDDE